MPAETGTETTRSDAPSTDESLFGDAADNAAAVPAKQQVSNEETEQDGQETTATAAEEQNADGGTAQDPEGPDDAGDRAADGSQGTDDVEADTQQDDLKVVLSIKGGRATIGVQQPLSDPHIETFDDRDLSAVAQEVPAVVGRARAKWEEAPKHPTYVRPAPPSRRRNRRQQGAAQGATGGTQEAETQQQTLRLF